MSRFINVAAFAICLTNVSIPTAQAGDLSAQEQSVCISLKHCIDIASRHDASEFDYDVLEAEFRKFDEAGKRALFTLLDSEDGQADIAHMIANLGPLSAQDRQRIQKNWSQDAAQIYLPLLLDGHPMSRDFLLRSLGYPDADVREQVRLALIRLPQIVQRAPISKDIQEPLLTALLKDPVSEAAPYLARLNPAGSEKQFAAFLRSGDSKIVTVAYSALYRNNPAQAFNMLLAEMESFETSTQSRAVGEMLATRHKFRRDGFYLKFAQDMSGDPKLSTSARASGLHAVLTIADGPFPELTPARAEALSFLVKAEPFWAQDQYLSYLRAAKAEAAMGLIWDIARTENWINRDRIASFYEGHSLEDAVTASLLKANDWRSFSTGIRRAKPVHEQLIRAQTNHPVKEISTAARQKLKLPLSKSLSQNCSIPKFDLDDMRAQMPFFDKPWTVTQNKARLVLSREYLTTAHPSASGWLAGYDLGGPRLRSSHEGGAVIFYENKSGGFNTIGNFSGPLAILPERPLQLGEVTNQFWLIDRWDGASSDVSAYRLDVAGISPRIEHIGALPQSARDFSVTPEGDLLIAFDTKEQMAIRMTKTGAMSLACSSNRASQSPRAPQ